MEITKYIKAEGIGNIDCNYLKVQFYYDLGGINYFTYQQEPRGYYLSVTPVIKESRGSYVSESYTAFTGTKICVKSVTRKSKKAETEALESVKIRLPYYLDSFCTGNGIDILEEVKFDV